VLNLVVRKESAKFKCSTQIKNELHPYSDNVVTDVLSTELGIRLGFVKISEFQGGGGLNTPNPAVRH
jgi:hypothetical protein